MALPKDFRFSDNPNVNAIAEARAELIFGTGWKHIDELKLSYPHKGWSALSADTEHGWVVRVMKKDYGNLGFEVSCFNKKLMQDPAQNIPADVGFDRNGSPLSHFHYSAGQVLDPSNGYPSRVDYAPDGSIATGWYVDQVSKMASVKASPEEISQRVTAAKRAGAVAICDSPQEIVALSAGESRQFLPAPRPAAGLLP